MGTRPRDPLALPRPAIVSIGIASLVGAVLFPLLTYTLSLATFGIAHVVAEMRYVDQRFSARVPRGPLVGITTLLALVVIVRVLTLTGAMSADTTRVVELLLVCALAAIPLPLLMERGGAKAVAGLAVCALLVVALAVSPLVGMLVLAVVHNATPVGFLVEAAPAQRRALVVAGSLVVFVGLPVLIATGAPAALAESIGWRSPTLSVFAVGELASHYKVYLPPALARMGAAEHLFSGIVFAQCMHYLVVIHVLPRLVDDEHAAPIVPWPRPARFVTLLVVVSAAFLAGFAHDFGGARSIYGVFAAVHAWIEVPILLYALVLAAPSARALASS